MENIGSLILTAGIGMVGVVFGALLNAILRRSSRRELYSPRVFEKRLAAYEGLMEHLFRGSEVAEQVIESDDLTQEQRLEMISVAIHKIIDFHEKNRLYLDEEISVHCMALFMGTEEIHDAAEDKKEKLLGNYRKMRRDALDMIYEDSGVAEINRLFKSINKPEVKGEFIKQFRQKKREAATYKG